jgi:hypothetical protein
MPGGNASGTGSRWYHRLKRAELPFGIAWFAFGVWYIATEFASGGPRPTGVLSGLIAVIGGFIFSLGGWVYRREQEAADRDDKPG